LYDFDRVDANGNTRELHVDMALDAINYKKTQSQKGYTRTENSCNEMVDCSYFTTNFIPLNGQLRFQKDKSTFHVYMCVAGSFSLEVDQTIYHYQKGDTILMPAAISTYKFDGVASILEIYIK
jgi:mannose-6-phosphate isomerase